MINIKTQSGYGLIELMVSITIGLFLLLGLSTTFLAMNQTYNQRQGLAAFQDNERMAMSFLSTAIHNAGFYPNALATPPITPQQALSGTGNGTSGADTLSVTFVAPPTASASAFQGCSANLIPGDTYNDTFSYDSSSGSLVCTETDTTAATTTTITLITGLAGMNIYYGVDTTGAGSVTRYMPATTATWGSVKSVQVTLLFTNPLTGQPGQAATVSLSQTIPNLVAI